MSLQVIRLLDTKSYNEICLLKPYYSSYFDTL